MDSNEFKDENIENEIEETVEEIEETVEEIEETVEDATEEVEESKKTDWVKELREWAVAIIAAVLIALFVRQFVFTLVNVKGASMEPSLHENDRLYVNRLFYKPEKGDVVIFRPKTDPNRPYVKRVIATEGDTVYIDFRTGDVYVNDEIIDEPYIKAKSKAIHGYISKLIREDRYAKDDPILIQPGYVWCMGDNRNNSLDSRELGPIPVDEIIGGAVFRFWPLSDFGGVNYDAED